MLNQTEHSGRIARFQERLAARDLDGALLNHPIDIFYFSGTRQNGVLWVPASGEARLMIRKSLTRAREEATGVEVLAFPPSREFASALPGSARRIGLTFDVLTLQQYRLFEKLLAACEFVDVAGEVRNLRSVKSEQELATMRSGAERLCGVFAEIPSFLRPGMREVDLAAELELRLRKAGGEGYVRMRSYNQELFMGLAVAGSSAGRSGFFDGAVTGAGLSAAAAHGASEALIAENEPIMIDYTGVFGGYILDMTRMFVVGSLPAELRRAFDVSMAIQQEIGDNLREGAIASSFFDRASAMAGEAGFEGHFMGAPGEQARFVGHGVGLELDELPVLAKGFDVPLQKNQTVAVEPKFVFPDLGVVGIENTFAVGESAGCRLTGLADDLVAL